MKRRAAFCLALVPLSMCVAPAPLQSQAVARVAARAPAPIAGRGAPRRTASAVRVGKWALLGATVGFGVYALRHTNRAQRHYDSLIAACTTRPLECDLVSGRYADEGIERIYQRTLEQDRRARIGIVGGQATLLGSLALFVYDLRNGRGPADIPYPTGAASRAPAPRIAAGVRLAF